MFKENISINTSVKRQAQSCPPQPHNRISRSPEKPHPFLLTNSYSDSQVSIGDEYQSKLPNVCSFVCKSTNRWEKLLTLFCFQFAYNLLSLAFIWSLYYFYCISVIQYRFGIAIRQEQNREKLMHFLAHFYSQRKKLAYLYYTKQIIVLSKLVVFCPNCGKNLLTHSGRKL